MLPGKVLRSPHLHARIIRIDTANARVLPGVYAANTAQDLPDLLTGRQLRDVPVLARGKFRFVGEGVAAVAAETHDIAEKALTLAHPD